MSLARAGARPALRFWTLQVAGWSAYGLALMVPWLGVYPVAMMLPNKVAIAGTGILVSTALREAYGAARRRGLGREAQLLLALPASLLAGMAWSLALALMTGEPALEALSTGGALASGLPQLAGPLYHALVMLLWSLAYLALANRLDPAPAGQPAADRLVLRDGRRALMVGRAEIDWIEARGDYVRVHLDGRTLLVRSSLSHLAETLPPECFVRVHRSAIVNLSRVREVAPLRNNDREVVLQNGTRLRASRTHAAALEAALNALRPG